MEELECRLSSDLDAQSRFRIGAGFALDAIIKAEITDQQVSTAQSQLDEMRADVDGSNLIDEIEAFLRNPN